MGSHHDRSVTKCGFILQHFTTLLQHSLACSLSVIKYQGKEAQGKYTICSSEVAGLLEAPKPPKNQGRQKIGQK